MTLVKVCGLTREEDIKYANELLPDYVGFVFCKSKRQVSLEQGKKLIIDKLDKRIKTVGVFQNDDIEKVKCIAVNLKLNVIQLHGIEDKNYIQALQEFKLWKCMSIDVASSSQEDLKEAIKGYEEKINDISKYNIEAMLVDSSANGSSGGSGMSFNWNILNNLKITKPLVMAGGLNPRNIEEALRKVKPYAVDVSSGVEENGVKNFEKIKSFIEKVRNF
ncbi:phosphoribosylanthranilate isomerase [Clostridium thailandense]|uniref:phosphoribosylanthranilate isomerase n=1 Tax=Clostridium thailandense TaxID=2794346 RepID=UPI003989A87B